MCVCASCVQENWRTQQVQRLCSSLERCAVFRAWPRHVLHELSCKGLVREVQPGTIVVPQVIEQA